MNTESDYFPPDACHKCGHYLASNGDCINPDCLPDNWDICETIDGSYFVTCNGCQMFGDIDHTIGVGTATFKTRHNAYSTAIAYLTPTHKE